MLNIAGRETTDSRVPAMKSAQDAGGVTIERSLDAGRAARERSLIAGRLPGWVARAPAAARRP